MHKAHDILVDELKMASEKVRIGGLYFHYKNPEQYYKVLRLAVIESDDTICVIYEAQYGDKVAFVRSLSSWLDEVEWQNQRTDRFTLIV